MRYLLILMVYVSSWSQAVDGAEIADVTMVDSTTVGGTTLPLRGTAVQKWKRFWTIHATGWWQDPATTVEADVAKVLELHYFHDIEADDFRTATIEGFARGRSETEIASLAERRDQWNVAYRDIKEGERYRIAYDPVRGTSLSKGAEELVVIPGADFAQAIFGIWIGENPVESNHRSDLLDGK